MRFFRTSPLKLGRFGSVTLALYLVPDFDQPGYEKSTGSLMARVVIQGNAFDQSRSEP